jgi:hypothetical protein
MLVKALDVLVHLGEMPISVGHIDEVEVEGEKRGGKGIWLDIFGNRSSLKHYIIRCFLLSPDSNSDVVPMMLGEDARI